MNGNWLRILIVFFFLFCFLGVFLLIFLVFLSLLSNQEDLSPSSLPESSLYRYLRINPTTKTTEFGVSEMASTDDQLFYSNSNGFYTLLSRDFESTEYKCTGKCTCDSERRSSHVLSRKTLFFLVASGSSFLAAKRAKEYFQEECENSFHDSCPSPSVIISAVDECSPAVHHVEEETPATTEEEDNESSEKEKKVYTEGFYCQGRCLPVGEDDVVAVGRNSFIEEGGNEKEFDLVEYAFRDMFNSKVNSKEVMDCNEMYFTRIIDDKFAAEAAKEKAFQKWRDDKVISGSRNLHVAALYSFAWELNLLCTQQGFQMIPDTPKISYCEGWEGFVLKRVEFDPLSNPTLRCKDLSKAPIRMDVQMEKE